MECASHRSALKGGTPLWYRRPEKCDQSVVPWSSSDSTAEGRN